MSASMRTALLVYSGITVKMMVDSDLGAQLSTMFMVQYAPDGVGRRPRPSVRGDLLLPRGRAEATFDGERYELGPGDVAWAGVGACTASATSATRCAGWRLRRRSRRPPLLPVRARLGLPAGGQGMTDGPPPLVVVVGGTAGIGREIARRYADAGDGSSLTGRDASARDGRQGVGGDRAGIALDLSEPASIAAALADVGRVDHVVSPRSTRHQHSRGLRHRRGDRLSPQAGRLHRGGPRAAAPAGRRRLSCCSAGGPRTGPTRARPPSPRSTAASPAWCTPSLSSWRRAGSTPCTPASSPTARSGRARRRRPTVREHTPTGRNVDDGRRRRRGRLPAPEPLRSTASTFRRRRVDAQ